MCVCVFYIRDEYLVKVKAQVMTRDDSSGGWVPTSGGGISLVGLRTLSSSSVDTQYLIDGQKVSDHTVGIHKRSCDLLY